MRVAVVSRRRRFERITVILGRRGFVAVMARMQMRPDLAARQMIGGIADVRDTSKGAVEREDQRQKDGKKQSHFRRF